MNRLCIPAFAFLFALQAMAAPCNPQAFLSKILQTPDQTQEWLAKHFQYHDIKDFNADLYYRSRDEFENLKTVGQLPSEPAATEFEKSVAWFDTQTSTSEKLPTLIDVLEHGTQSQKLRLSEWIDQYGSERLTEYQAKQAATDLSLILHDTKFTIAELNKHGASTLARKMVASQYHEAILQEQMLTALKDSDYLKKENLFNALARIRDTSPAKWILSGGSNASSLAKLRSWSRIIFVTLPNHRFAKLSVEDLEILMKTGGVNSEKFAEIAAKYKGKVEFQAFYNSTQALISQVSRILWLELVMHKYHQYQDRKAKLNAKDHS